MAFQGEGGRPVVNVNRTIATGNMTLTKHMAILKKKTLTAINLSGCCHAATTISSTSTSSSSSSSCPQKTPPEVQTTDVGQLHIQKLFYYHFFDVHLIMKGFKCKFFRRVL